MSAPRWSVVVPTFNRHDALAACLDRLAPGAQDVAAAAYEVVVTDDARSDGTRTFLAERYPWARWTPGPARGPASNRNHGASEAKGEWLAFTDDDTLPDRGWLRAFAHAVAEAEQEAVDAGADIAVSAEALEGRTTCAAGFGTPMFYAPVNETGGWFWSCNIAVRADRFRTIGGFDEGFAVAHMEDQDLRERLVAAGVRIRWVPEAVVDHPPRRQPSGRALGLLRGAEVRYLVKHGAPAPLRWHLLRGIASLRLGIIRSLPWSGDSLRALGSLASELWTVQLHLAEWERAARREFAGTPAR
ncbi:MAG: glycosyltransferase [Gemmatimonadota bacterium]|nr:glycosyltransferase [Gemmatimonadota bacterium]